MNKIKTFFASVWAKISSMFSDELTAKSFAWLLVLLVLLVLGFDGLGCLLVLGTMGYIWIAPQLELIKSKLAGWMESIKEAISNIKFIQAIMDKFKKPEAAE